MSDDKTQYAVVDGHYLLPFEDAVELLRLMSRAERVTQTYSHETPFNLSKNDGATLRLVTTAQRAAMYLDA